MGYCLIPVVFMKQLENYRWLVNPIKSLPNLTHHRSCFLLDEAKIDDQVLREDVSAIPAIFPKDGAEMTEEKTKKANKTRYSTLSL